MCTLMLRNVARPGMTCVWFLVGAGILSGTVVHAPSAHLHTPPYYWQAFTRLQLWFLMPESANPPSPHIPIVRSLLFPPSKFSQISSKILCTNRVQPFWWLQVLHVYQPGYLRLYFLKIFPGSQQLSSYFVHLSKLMDNTTLMWLCIGLQNRF